MLLQYLVNNKDEVPASVAEFLQDTSQSALRIGLFCLNDFLHIV